MSKSKPVEEMALEELLAERDALAAQRTELRLRQVAVQDQIALQEALKGLPPELVRRITIGGAVSTEGGKD